MTDVFIYSALVIFGAALGSFVAATVWRVRARQLEADKAAGQEYDKQELKMLRPLLGKKTKEDRSQCLHCKKPLRWFELIPIVSWVVQKGRCRSCKNKIGSFEIIAEVGLALFFALSYAFWPLELDAPLEILHFALWLIAGVVMAFLFAYDAKWFLLPDIGMIALIVLGAGVTGIVAAQSEAPLEVVFSAAGAVAVIGGIYGALHVVSRGRWVGLGDAILGVGLGLLLTQWGFALVALFMANFIGFLIVVPLLASGKMKRNTHVPFGPLLIAGTIIAWFFGAPIIEWYMGGMGITF